MALRAGDMVLFDSVRSGPYSGGRMQKSVIRDWVERLASTPAVAGQIATGNIGHRAMNAIQSGGTSLLAGGILGAINATSENGLDVKVMGHSLPVDAVGAAILSLASIPPGDGRGMAVLGNTCWSIFGFRKMTEFFAERKLAKGGALPAHLTPGSKMSGEDGDYSTPSDGDPIVAAAQAL